MLTTVNSFYGHVSSRKGQSKVPSTLNLFSPEHQRPFLHETGSPQQIHALVQIIFNLLTDNLPISEEDTRKVITYKDSLVKLAEPSIPYRKKKLVLVQEGSSFIQDALTPVITSLGFLTIYKSRTSLYRKRRLG